jgi:hypothetical protein
MKREELRQRLAASDEAGLTSIADQIAKESLEAPRAMVHVWAAGADESAGKACLVAMQLQEFLIEPALEESAAASGARRVTMLDAAIEALLPFRRHALRQLDPLLKDTTVLSAEGLAEPPKKGALPPRVCDAAYVHIRRLARVSDPAAAKLHTEPEFLALSYAERDQELQRWLLSKPCGALHRAIYDFGAG